MRSVEPGARWENGFAEPFFSRLRDELLNVEEFVNLAEARWFARRRREEYNHHRPHSSLGYQPPANFAANFAAGLAAADRSDSVTCSLARSFISRGAGV